MPPVFGFRPKQPVIWYHSRLDRSNHHCLYCGRFVGDGYLPSNEEHWIGKKFVPPGAFRTGQEFNFLFRACKECNGRKSRLEAHLSSVTLFTSPARLTDQGIDERARHKAEEEFHPVDRKPVANAQRELSLNVTGRGISMQFGLTGPPQPHAEYVAELARMHIQGLFSLVTTADPVKGTLCWLSPELFRLVGWYASDDWGNPHLIEVSRRVHDWPRLALVDTAGGFFRAVARRESCEEAEWFWALEWNQSLRIFGGITDRERPKVFDGLPPMPWVQLDAGTRWRRERPLQEGEDILFVD